MRVWRAVRSRRLAVWLLTGLTTYASLSAAIPQTSVDPAAAAAWDAANPGIAPIATVLGLHSAFSTPLFLGACLLVGVSTAACAWERSFTAVRDLRALRGGSVPARSHALDPIELPACIEAPIVLDAASRALGTLKLRSRRSATHGDDDLQESLSGSSGLLGLFGSSLFHWAIAGLMLAAAVGQLTKYEAVVQLALSETVQDSADAYGAGLSAGPFATGYSRDSLRFEELDFDHVVGGVARGAAPLISVEGDGTTRAREWVFPNHPLRTGSLSVHSATVAPVLQATIRTGAGETPVEAWFAFDDRSPRAIDVPDASGEQTTSLVITPLGDQTVSFALAETIDEPSGPVAVGETVELAEDLAVVVDALTYGAQVRVVRDWTMPVVFAMLMLLVLGSSLTVFVPTRGVRIEYATDSAEDLGDAAAPRTLRVRVSCPKSDPAFPARVRDAITEAVAALQMDDVKETV